MPKPRSSNHKKQGTPSDWGKTKPFWCLTYGKGFGSPEQTLKHMAEANHQNESMSMGSRGLSKRRQLEAFKLRNK